MTRPHLPLPVEPAEGPVDHRVPVCEVVPAPGVSGGLLSAPLPLAGVGASAESGGGCCG
ncbi:hypothetical protein GCM10027187_21370 [Streptosporangium sandarakinum]